jgi:serine/threonine protein kinase
MIKKEKSTECFAGQEIATGRKVAIKKIKVGGFKDGLDMSAIREVKFLQELHHPNILEVGPFGEPPVWIT